MVRKYIRHPSDIPIEFSVKDIKLKKESLSNISVGGLAIRTSERVDIGRQIDLCIASVRPMFRAAGRVAWCLKRSDHYDVGVQFVESEDAFRARMVEQVCHIEHYKKEVLVTEGRALSGEEAASEWINKYASDFPPLGEPSKQGQTKRPL
ncbi:MAG: type IV pilus assembly PilZ [Halothiobacillaceae bacterium]|nr:MAG: type IV pilus assembly PilZ [Halothiobacillaceae bacterium]